MGNQLRLKKDGLSEMQAKLVNRVNTMQAVLNGPVFNKYKLAQRSRWESENASEGATWPKLDAKYQQQKLTRFKAFPGGGRKMMVATSRLYMAATGQDSSGFMKVATNEKLVIAINATSIPYARYAAEERPFMKFSTNTIKEMRAIISKYIRQGA